MSGITGKNVTVTILDDGIEHNHPDLKKNYDAKASKGKLGVRWRRTKFCWLPKFFPGVCRVFVYLPLRFYLAKKNCVIMVEICSGKLMVEVFESLPDLNCYQF